MAKEKGEKPAIIDRTTEKRVTYSRALIGALILSKKYKSYQKGYIGIMIPTSAGAALATVAALMSGRVPVMINYSTGAENNVKYAQKKCGFKTVITSRALLEKIKCPVIDGMIMIEDIMSGVSALDKISAALKSKLPLSLLLKLVHSGSENDTAAILFTSGSEKDPKAVQLTHKNIISNIESFGGYVKISGED